MIDICEVSVMAVEMWIIRYIVHNPGPKLVEVHEVDRDYISYFDIMEKIKKDMGYKSCDSVYYQRKGSVQEMVELKDDACVMNMLEVFDVEKEVNLHVFKNMQPNSHLPSHAEMYKSIPVVAIEDSDQADYHDSGYLLSDVEYDDPGVYWKELHENELASEGSSDDSDFDVHAESEKLRAIYGEKKKKELESKGIYSEDEIEDLFDVTEGLEGIDMDDIALPMSQKDKEIAFGKSEEAKLKKEKAEKKRALAKAREKRKPTDDMDLSDPPSSDGGNDPFEDSDEDARVMEDGRKRKRPTRLLQPRMEFDESIMDDDDQMAKGMCFKDVKEFRMALESSHIKQGRSYNFLKNKMEKVKVRCAGSNCPFYLFASKIAGESTFMIRQAVVEHTCGITREASRLKSTWLAKHIISKILFMLPLS